MLLQLVEEMLTLVGGLVIAYFVYVLLTRKDDKPTTDTPNMAHTALRELVGRAVDEARKLPGLSGSEMGRAPPESDASEQAYEDLLATAILNKVIEKYQREQVDGNSNVLRGKESPRPKYIKSEIEVGLDEGVEEGSSSLEPLSQDEYSSDCSMPPGKHAKGRQEPLSLTIEEHIEEVTTTYTSDEDREQNESNGLDFGNAHRVPFPEFGMDIVDPSQESSEETREDEASAPTHVDHVSPIESWEENWLFQKKRIQTRSEPVAMLVPNPSADFRALIGDKDAEDTSDLSECSAQSDEEIEEELTEAINSVVPRVAFAETAEEAEQDIVERITAPANESAKLAEENGRETHRDGSSSRQEAENTGTPQEIEELHEAGGKAAQEKSNVRGTDEVDRLGNLQVESPKVRSICTEEAHLHERKEKNTFAVTITAESLTEESRENPTDKLVEGERKWTDLSSDPNARTASGESATEVLSTRDQEEEAVSLVEKSASSPRIADVTSSSAFAIPRRLMTEGRATSELPKTPSPSPASDSSEDEPGGATTTRGCDPKSLDEKLGSIDRKSLPEEIAERLSSAESVETNVRTWEESSMRRGTSTSENGAQQENEYTEHCDIATRRQVDDLGKIDTTRGKGRDEDLEVAPPIPKTPPPSIEMLRQCREAVGLADAVPVADPVAPRESRRIELEQELSAPPRPGTIAEREHKKWENAPPLENNPYSEENIQKRLWERQYSRRSSSDLIGDNSELPENPGVPLQVVLGANQPDFKRYGRDYYINASKSSSGERAKRTGRPGSSLSQHSSLTGSDLDRQDQIQYVETESTGSSTASEARSKVAKWQRGNNSETTRSMPVKCPDASSESRNEQRRYYTGNVTTAHRSWDSQEVDEILERERKNSKNEINAKLNNRESFNGTATPEKTFSDDNQRKIRRIDLRAYGFENEFTENQGTFAKKSRERAVNKLDLKSFGYGDEVDGKSRTIAKSNLGRGDENARTGSLRELARRETFGAYEAALRRSSEALSVEKNRAVVRQSFGSMKPAKSMPNVTKSERCSVTSDDGSSERYESEDDIVVKSLSEIGTENRLRRETIKASAKSQGWWKSETAIPSDEKIYSEHPTRSSEILSSSWKCFEGTAESGEEFRSYVDCDVDKLPMPSVRRLAEAFDRTPADKPVVASKISKSVNNIDKERSRTPEIHLVETPRQMHSLTARSLSREFREGLRQIPAKVTSPPASHVIVEQSKVPEGCVSPLVSSEELDVDGKDTVVIAPGKLKNNILFWEQLQRRS